MQLSSRRFIGWLGFVFLAGCDGAPDSDPPCSAEYPDAPDGAGEIVHVAAQCPEAGALGTADHPFTKIGDALAEAGDGAVLLVAGGEYEENLTLTRPVHIVGSSDAADPDAAGVVVKAPADTAVVVKAPDVTISGVRIEGAHVVGLRSDGGSVTLSGSVVAGTLAGSDAKFGIGVLATGDGGIILQNSRVSGSASTGVLVSGANAIILQSEVRDNGGAGVLLEHAAGEVKLEGVQVVGNTGLGVGVLSSRAIILQSEVKDTLANVDGLADGILATDISDGGVDLGPSHLTVKDTTLSGNARTGILCNGQTRTIILQNNKVQDNGLAEASRIVAGIWLQNGVGGEAGNEISGNTVSGNKFVGIHLMGETQGIILQNNTVSGTLLGEVFSGPDMVSIGDGISLFGGASAHILGNTVTGNGRFGLMLDGAPGAETEISGNTIQDNDQYGIILQNEADTIATEANTFGGNASGDVSSVPAGTYDVADQQLTLN